MATAIAKLSRIRTALEAAKSIDEVVDVRDQAAAVVTYAKAIGLSTQNVNAAVEVKLRAERKAGSLLASVNKVHGARGIGKKVEFHNGTSLADLGVDKKQSHRWQKLSQMPEDEFGKLVHRTNEEGKELTTAGVMREWAAMCKPSNGTPLECGTTISAALERLHSAVKRLYGEWPADQRNVLADKLRAYADELDSTGELAL